MSTNWLDVITSGSVTVGVPRQTSLTNAGLLAVLGHASLHVDAVGSFTNQGTMLAADGGTMTIFRGAYRGLTQVVQNTGLIEATGDGTIDVKPGIHSVLANSGQID